jgi:hypothetical protein
MRVPLVAVLVASVVGVSACGGGSTHTSSGKTPPASSSSSSAGNGPSALPADTCALLSASEVQLLLGAPGGPGTSRNLSTSASRCTFSANVNGGANLVQLDVQIGVTGDYFQQPTGVPASGVGDKAYYQAAPAGSGSYHFSVLAAQKGSVVVKLDAGGPLTGSQALHILTADVNEIFGHLGA